MTDPDPYLDTIARMEPEIAMVDTGGALASIAISLRRIADCLEGPAPKTGANINWVLYEIWQQMMTANNRR
jgi:hypothetical protein